jgi:hypothetical protein
MVKDRLGHEIRVGSRVVHFARQGSWMGVTVGTVADIFEATSELRMKVEESSSRPAGKLSQKIKSYNCVKI